MGASDGGIDGLGARTGVALAMRQRLSAYAHAMGGRRLLAAVIVVMVLWAIGAVGYLVIGPAIFIVTVPVAVAAILVMQLESRLRSQESGIRIRDAVEATQAAVARAAIETEASYRQIESLFSVFEMIDARAPLPAMRGWAISPDFARTMLSEFAARRPRVVLELGSGVSTLVGAYASVRLDLDCHIVSLDHNESYAETTRRMLARHGLADAATVLHAPLVSIEINGEEWMWYDHHALEGVEKIDVVIIDGPPGGRGTPLARYPALPLLAPMMNPHAVLLLDDGAREGEQAVVDRWKRERPDIRVERIDNEKGTFVIEVGD